MSADTRLISISYISQRRSHGRGREFESRRPRHFFSNTYRRGSIPSAGREGPKNGIGSSTLRRLLASICRDEETNDSCMRRSLFYAELFSATQFMSRCVCE
jgi:hypothetical protein